MGDFSLDMNVDNSLHHTGLASAHCNQSMSQLTFSELTVHTPRSDLPHDSLHIHAETDAPPSRSSDPPSQQATDIYEPTRRLPVSAAPAPPPRRFYHIWWHGIVRAAYDSKRIEQRASVARCYALSRASADLD